MAGSGRQTGASEGAVKLHVYCLAVAEDLDLEVDDLAWSTNIVTGEYILAIAAESGTAEIRLSQQEIDNYPRGISTGTINDKAREALEAIVE